MGQPKIQGEPSKGGNANTSLQTTNGKIKDLGAKPADKKVEATGAGASRANASVGQTEEGNATKWRTFLEGKEVYVLACIVGSISLVAIGVSLILSNHWESVPSFVAKNVFTNGNTDNIGNNKIPSHCFKDNFELGTAINLALSISVATLPIEI
jgi:hypothetical protein